MNLLKISLIISLIGVFLLLILSEVLEPKQIDINGIDNKLLNFLVYLHGHKARDTKKKRKKIMGMGYPASYFKLINKPTTPEGKIVWDANCLENVGRFGIKKSLRLEKHYKQTRKQTLNLVKKFIKRYKFYTPLGKKLGNPGIKIKRKWMNNELAKLKNKKRG